MPVYGFVPQSSPRKTYNGNLTSFFTYLKDVKLIDGTEYLQETHAGTEPASGNNVMFTNSAFTLSSSRERLASVFEELARNVSEM